MRTLTSTLTTAQQSSNIQPLMKLVISGNTFTKSRILKIDHDEDGPLSQKLTVVLDDRDKVVSALDLKGTTGVLSWGADTAVGEEYSACAPFTCIMQKEDSSMGSLNAVLTLEGIPNLLARDKALDNFIPSTSNDLTIKTLFTAIAGATSPHKQWLANTAYVVNDYVRAVTSNNKAFKCTVAGTSHGTTEPTWDTTIGNTTADNTVTWECVSTDNPFEGMTAYTVDYDSEDSLIDVNTPKDAFRIYVGGTRLAALRRLLDDTGCVMLVKEDGHIHIFVPVTSGTNVGWLSPTGHVDGGGVYTDDANAYDGDTATFAYVAMPLANWTDYLELTHAAILCDKVRVWAEITATVQPTTQNINVDAYYDGGWTSLYSNTLTENQWVEYQLAAKKSVTAIRVRLQRSGGSVSCLGRIMEAAFYVADTYQYSLEPEQHNFFSKSYRNSLVLPNKVIVSSQIDDSPQYTGEYTSAASYALLPKILPVKRRLPSNAQATAIATAIIGKLEIQAEQGSGVVPMNCGQEVYDYVKIIDARAGDTRYGNIGWIHRRYNAMVKDPERQWGMSFGFGKPDIGQRIDELLSDLQTYSDVGQVLDRMTVKDLYAENIHADSIELTEITVDDLTEGTTYKRTKSAAIDANGMVLLDATIGGTYGLVLATHLDAGKLKLTSAAVFDGKWYSQSGVSISATAGINIWGTNNALTTRATEAGTIQCAVNSSGQITAGAGAVFLDANGITVDGQVLTFKSSSTVEGYVYGSPYGLSISAAAGKNLTVAIGATYTTAGHHFGITGYDTYIYGDEVILTGTTWYPATSLGVTLGKTDKIFTGLYVNELFVTNTAYFYQSGNLKGSIYASLGNLSVIANAGLLNLVGYTGINMSVTTGTIDMSSGLAIKLPTSSASPSSPAAGWMYYDTDDNKAYIHNGTGWQALY